MNRRKRILTVMAVLLITAIIWLRPRHNQPAEQPVTESTAVQTNQPALPAKSAVRRPVPPAAVPAPTAVPNPPVQNGAAVVESRINQIQTEIEKGYDQWRTPIEFHGKVVDENTNPVATASVHFVWTDLSPKGTSEKDTTSDQAGLFSLSNTNGENLIVQVSKEGYYAYQRFGAAFNYAGESQNFVPDAANPVIFQLKKKGLAEPLVHVQSPMGGPKGFRIAKDGTAVEISLMTGKAVPIGQGDLEVQCWTDNEGKTPGEKYDWKCQISVPNGGILQPTHELDVQAPLDGYRTADVIDMPANRGTDWSSHASRNYFLKLASGNYARISFEVVAGGDHFFQLESFLNPSGSRSLEFDPQIAINP
ncbi:exported hypothetical protein [Verrucomicrobia bacterium]|nr:exported hypothetical protein [Verrucomicrobiota bacterium]